MAEDSYKEAKGRGERKAKLNHISIHPVKGGHRVVHHAHEMHSSPYGPSGEPMDEKEHVFSAEQGEELLAHLSKHAKINIEPGEASEAEPDEQSEKVKPAPHRSEAEEKGKD